MGIIRSYITINIDGNEFLFSEPIDSYQEALDRACDMLEECGTMATIIELIPDEDIFDEE